MIGLTTCLKLIYQAQMEIIWHHFYFNGPVSGLAMYQGEKVWFSPDRELMYDQLSDNSFERMFRVYHLNPDQLCFVEETQEEYRTKVGFNREHDGTKYKPIFKSEAKYVSPIIEETLKSKPGPLISMKDCVNYFPRFN